MKHITLITIFVAFALSLSMAQSPQSFNYQAVARDSFGTPLPLQHIHLRFTIHTGSSGGTTVYQENDTTTTDKLGMFVINIGTGTVTSGTFASIAWGSGSKYLQVEVDPTGGTSYTDMGATQLMSVPYALYAQKAGSVQNKQIGYGNSSGSITSDPGFTRDSANGNTNIKVIRGNNYYSLNLGDSNTLDFGSIVNVPSAALSYGDAGGAYTMNIGVGNIPSYGFGELGYLNLSDSSGNFAALDFGMFGGSPGLTATAGYGNAFSNSGSTLSLGPESLIMGYRTEGPDHLHGFSMDSNSLNIYSSPSTYHWTWPNAEGSNGQALVTNGSGGLGFSAISGKGTALGNHNIYGGNGLSTDTFNITINKNHIYDPGGAAVTTLRVILPSSPSDGDIFLLTFEKAVTTIVYLNGTVAGGALTTAVPGSQKIYTYYSGTSKWY